MSLVVSVGGPSLWLLGRSGVLVGFVKWEWGRRLGNKEGMVGRKGARLWAGIEGV